MNSSRNMYKSHKSIVNQHKPDTKSIPVWLYFFTLKMIVLRIVWLGDKIFKMQVSDYHKNLASGHLWGDRREETQGSFWDVVIFSFGDGFVDACFVIIK